MCITDATSPVAEQSPAPESCTAVDEESTTEKEVPEKSVLKSSAQTIKVEVQEEPMDMSQKSSPSATTSGTAGWPQSFTKFSSAQVDTTDVSSHMIQLAALAQNERKRRHSDVESTEVKIIELGKNADERTNNFSQYIFPDLFTSVIARGGIWR